MIKEVLSEDKIIEVLSENKIVGEFDGEFSWNNYWDSRRVINVKAKSQSDTEILITWDNQGVLNYTGHLVYVSTDGTNYILNKTISSIGLYTTISELTENTTYYIKVAPYLTLSSIGPLSDAASDTTFLTLLLDGNTVGFFDYTKQYAIDRENSFWSLQGTVLAASEVHEIDNVFEPTVIYDSNPQILDGDNVFKMWYTGGWGTTGICYAESLDGINWTKYDSNPIIADHHCSHCIKIGDQYWLYTNKQTNDAFDLYISNDGIIFNLDTANVITKGAFGEWDHAGVGNIFIIVEDDIWYAFYDAYITVPTPTWRIGLATSNDGKTWTKYGIDTLIQHNAMMGHVHVEKINGVFYLWSHGGCYDGLPTDINPRFKSIDLYNWCQDIDDFTLMRRTADEGYDTFYGQLADGCFLEHGGQVYFYYIASEDGRVQTGEMHIKLAIADTTLDELIAVDLTDYNNNNVVRWNDLFQYCNNLIGVGTTTLPELTDTGLLFDGVNDTLRSKQFTLNQPETIYIVFKQITWTLYRQIYDGRLTNRMALQQQAVTPKLIIYAGSNSDQDDNLILNTYGIVRAIYNGANSKFQIDDNVAWTGDAGASNAEGLCLGALFNGAATSNWSNIEVKEFIVRNVADSDATFNAIYTYLKNKYSL